MKKTTPAALDHGRTPDTLTDPHRRRFLGAVGLSALAVPVLGLSGCGGGETSSGSAAESSAPAQPSASQSSQSSKPAPSAPATESAATPEPAAPSGDAMKDSSTIATDAMPKVDPNGAQAKGLAYVEDATTSTNGRYKAGQNCGNCALYQGGQEPWGACPLFAGRRVKAAGWCTAYAPAG